MRARTTDAEHFVQHPHLPSAQKQLQTHRDILRQPQYRVKIWDETVSRQDIAASERISHLQAVSIARSPLTLPFAPDEHAERAEKNATIKAADICDIQGIIISPLAECSALRRHEPFQIYVQSLSRRRGKLTLASRVSSWNSLSER